MDLNLKKKLRSQLTYQQGTIKKKKSASAIKLFKNPIGSNAATQTNAEAQVGITWNAQESRSSLTKYKTSNSYVNTVNEESQIKKVNLPIKNSNRTSIHDHNLIISFIANQMHFLLRGPNVF